MKPQIKCIIKFRESEEGTYDKKKSPWLQYLCDITVLVEGKRYGIAIQCDKESFEAKTMPLDRIEGIVQITGRTIRNHFTQ